MSRGDKWLGLAMAVLGVVKRGYPYNVLISQYKHVCCGVVESHFQEVYNTGRSPGTF